MTPAENDKPHDEETAAELRPLPGAPLPGDPRRQARRATDDTLPDVPVMEQLPGQDAMPDPGYPEMPAAPREFAVGPPEPPRPSFQPAEPEQRPRAPEPVWSPDPYAAPRLPDDAPPLRGPAVPWSQVRAGGGRGTAGRPPPAPPAPLAQPDDPGVGPGTAPGAGPVPGAGTAPAPAQLAEPSGEPPLVRPAVPPGGWRRRLHRAAGRRDRAAEAARGDLISRIRAPLAGGHHRVAVLGLRGGVGKTTITVGLGATLASVRGDRVIAMDAAPGGGTLADRVWPQVPATVRDLLRKRAMIGGHADVRALTALTASGLEILAADRDPAVSVAFSADDYRAVAAVLGHYYAIGLTDCGTGLLHPAMTGILELTDQIVLVTAPSAGGARSASAALDWLEAHHRQDLVRGGLVVLSAVRPPVRPGVAVDRLEQHFAARCRAVVRIPYDQHCDEGAELELGFLSHETTEAYLTLAALVVDGFSRSARSARSVADAAPGPPLA